MSVEVTAHSGLFGRFAPTSEKVRYSCMGARRHMHVTFKFVRMGTHDAPVVDTWSGEPHIFSTEGYGHARENGELLDSLYTHVYGIVAKSI